MDIFENFSALFAEVWEKGIFGIDIFQILVGLGIFLIFLLFRGLISKIIINRLKKIAKKNNIALLNSNDYLCNEEEQRCDFFTDNNEKISFDYGHYSIAGARYLGKKISKMDWFKQL